MAFLGDVKQDLLHCDLDALSRDELVGLLKSVRECLQSGSCPCDTHGHRSHSLLPQTRNGTLRLRSISHPSNGGLSTAPSPPFSPGVIDQWPGSSQRGSHSLSNSDNNNAGLLKANDSPGTSNSKGGLLGFDNQEGQPTKAFYSVEKVSSTTSNSLFSPQLGGLGMIPKVICEEDPLDHNVYTAMDPVAIGSPTDPLYVTGSVGTSSSTSYTSFSYSVMESGSPRVRESPENSSSRTVGNHSVQASPALNNSQSLQTSTALNNSQSLQASPALNNSQSNSCPTVNRTQMHPNFSNTGAFELHAVAEPPPISEDPVHIISLTAKNRSADWNINNNNNNNNNNNSSSSTSSNNNSNNNHNNTSSSKEGEGLSIHPNEPHDMQYPQKKKDSESLLPPPPPPPNVNANVNATATSQRQLAVAPSLRQIVVSDEYQPHRQRGINTIQHYCGAISNALHLPRGWDRVTNYFFEDDANNSSSSSSSSTDEDNGTAATAEEYAPSNTSNHTAKIWSVDEKSPIPLPPTVVHPPSALSPQHSEKLMNPLSGSGGSAMYHQQHRPLDIRPSTADFYDDTASARSMNRVEMFETGRLRKRKDRRTGAKYINGYCVIKDIGRGSTSKVKLAYDNTTNRLVAIKQVRRASTKFRVGGPSESQQMFQGFLREVGIVRKLRHKNIVSVYEIIDDPTASVVCLVMQYIDNGPIRKLKIRPDTDTVCEKIPSGELLGYAKQMLAGLVYLHRKDVVHRDIKPENILISKEKRVYLADFGVAEAFDDHYQAKLERLMATSVEAGVHGPLNVSSADGPLALGTRGTMLFLAPELWARSRPAGKPLDIWAMGVTLFTLLTGKLPFLKLEDINDPAMPNLPTEYGDDWFTILSGMLNRDPCQRLTAEAALVLVGRAHEREKEIKKQRLSDANSHNSNSFNVVGSGGSRSDLFIASSPMSDSRRLHMAHAKLSQPRGRVPSARTPPRVEELPCPPVNKFSAGFLRLQTSGTVFAERSSKKLGSGKISVDGTLVSA